MTLLLLLSLAAPAETDPSEIPDEAPDLSVPAPPLPTLVRAEPSLALGLGLAVPAADLAPAPLVRLEVGASLRPLQGRVRPFASVAWTAPRLEGTASDERLPSEGGAATWSLTLAQAQLAAGVALRALPHGAPISPELSLAPAALAVRTTLRGDSGGRDLGGDAAWQLRPGFLVAADLVVDAGPGRLRLGVTAAGGRVETLSAGPVDTLSFTPALAYQVPLSTREAP